MFPILKVNLFEESSKYVGDGALPLRISRANLLRHLPKIAQLIV